MIGCKIIGLVPAFALCALAQWFDSPSALAQRVSEQTEHKLTFNFELRGRYEQHDGVAFGKDPDLENGVIRTRFAASYRPVSWLKFSGMLQDARSPWYGANAPNSVRDPVDLQESYLELFPDTKTGFGMTAGRRMISYGEGRLIGVPDWSPLARTYDHARVYYRWPKARLEFLFVSPVKIRLDGFNKPVLGDHIWGAYTVFPGLYKKTALDWYVLRREQNRPGGFTGGSTLAGTDKLRINTFGFRLYGPLPSAFAYSIEGAVQTGKVAVARQRAGAWVSRLSKDFSVSGKTLTASLEYKFASGNKDPHDLSRNGTFDQLYASNHDRFGHEDLFGWRNVHDLRSLEALAVTKAIAVNFMYNNLWLASARDALYNSQGRAIAQSAAGTAGRHIGQETDLFATYRHEHWLLGAGCGYFFAGDFVRHTTPGASPIYVYFFHDYSF